MNTRALTVTLEGAVWRKSSFSGGSQGQCVEVADIRSHGGVAVRDSKNPTGPVLLMAPEAFASFLTSAAHGAFDRL
ncbi:DUF397 domain-containing protein [Streptomyces sp. NPDC059816]|uniref:DUF397 domain-containing protein n=1 Tax=Streptomyces sp. NPDC059816 TaxID=3346960 RepID=UPI003665BB28